MAIISLHLRVVIRGHILGQVFENVAWYSPGGAAFLTATATGVGQAYWNDIKSVWRAALPNTPNLTTESILVDEPGPTGAFGEYPIPTAEQQGLRDPVATGDLLPTFNACAVRLAVATRATRPGQKRFVGGCENDQANNVWNAPYVTLINALAAKFDSIITLGVPVATGILTPEVVSIDRVNGDIVGSQAVIGHVTNPRVTSQVSRKFGRGR